MPPTAPMTGVRSACCCWRAIAARSGCADVDGRDVSEMVGVAVVVEVAEDVEVAEGVVELDADEPLEMLAVGVGVGVDVTEVPVEGEGVGVGGVRNMLNGLL